MIPREKLRKIRKTMKRIEITTRKVVNETLAGQYHSVFKGRGIEFDEVREYVPGDDVRTIDWNVTSRMGHPFTKQFVEERELTVMLVVDASASMDFGSTEEFKHERAAEICALLAFSAIKNNDRVGLVIFTDRVELHIPPRKGRSHVMRLVRDVLFFQPRGRGSDIAGALEYVNRTRVKKSVLFLISDFLERAGIHKVPRIEDLQETPGFRQPLQILARKHDVVAIQLLDQREEILPRMGLIRVEDPETGEQTVIDTSSRRWREKYMQLRQSELAGLQRYWKTHGIDNLVVHTDRDYETEIIKFFRKRAQRQR